MNKPIASTIKLFLFAYIICLAADLVAILSGFDSLRYVSKVLLMLFLLGYFLAATRISISGLKKWIVLALLFSWGGDVLLLFDGRDPVFFLLGLSSFLIAHVFYIVYFHRIRLTGLIKPRLIPVLVVVLYYAGLIYLLSPYLGDMVLPVRVYGIVISFMLMLALHMLFIRQRMAGILMTVGAVLFVISDSVLAINKFYHPFAAAGFLVMFTYGAAQLLIVYGAIRYINAGALQKQ